MFHYFLVILQIESTLILIIVLVSLLSLAGILISKLAIDPLELYTRNLQSLSKETLHELNLPISTIQTNLHMLKKNINDAKDAKRVARIESACSMLSQRYNELDYMIKTQTKQELRETFDLCELIQQRINFLQPLYPQIYFDLAITSVEVFTDKIGLTKVIDNLIDNGIKYSPSSNTIKIELDKDTLCIEDFGIGMDEVELLKIFDTYYQSDQSIKGFGIGLTMVKRFCDTNEIALNFHSQVGVGTKVTLQFKGK